MVNINARTTNDNNASVSLIQEQMINAILYSVMINVPWGKISEVMPKPQLETKELAEIYLQKISSDSACIDFDAEIWDLSSFLQEATPASGIFNFQLIPNHTKELVKLFVLYDIAKTKSISTSKTNYSYLSTLLTALFSEQHDQTEIVISLARVQSVLKNGHSSHRTNVYKGVTLRRFLVFDAAVNNKVISATILDGIDLFLKEERQLLQRSKKLRKYPSIPEDLVTIIQRKALTVMSSPSEPHNMRMAACCLIIQVWLGLRPIELALLRRRDYYKRMSHGRIMPYCVYHSPKNKMKSFPIYCFPLAAQAVEMALQLAKENGCESIENLLYVIRKNGPKSLNSKSLSRLLDNFYVKYLSDDVNHPWSEISPHKKDKNRIIYTPSIYQFRVHLCSYLYDKGVSRGWIEQNMSHLDSLSYGYYNRKKDELEQKDREGVTNFIEQVLINKMTPIGIVGPQLLDDINTTAIQVERNIDAIVDALGKKYRLRTLAFGICAKASVSRCQGETEYEKLLCACGDCSKIVYTLEDFPEAYMRFNNLKQTYRANRDSGRENAATKELFIINRLLSNRLLPELMQLKKEIQECGYNDIMNKYPGIDRLQIDLKTLEEDIELWKKKMN